MLNDEHCDTILYSGALPIQVREHYGRLTNLGRRFGGNPDGLLQSRHLCLDDTFHIGLG